jgi:hypothetical protein
MLLVVLFLGLCYIEFTDLPVSGQYLTENVLMTYRYTRTECIVHAECLGDPEWCFRALNELLDCGSDLRSVDYANKEVACIDKTGHVPRMHMVPLRGDRRREEDPLQCAGWREGIQKDL